ncbi:MAG: tyrosine-type recombinase/integrase [Candidatus Competibacterales bacterium]
MDTPQDHPAPPPGHALIPRQAHSDDQVVALWLMGHESRHTRDNYRRCAEAFLDDLGKPLARITVGDLQCWRQGLETRGLKPATVANRTAIAKSLLRFAHRIGYLPFNPGELLKSPRLKTDLAERLLSEQQIKALIEATKGRDRAILLTLYGAGLRVSELCGLRVKDLRFRDAEKGDDTPKEVVLTVFGKGGKTRFVAVRPKVAEALAAQIKGRSREAPVFPSPKNPAKSITPRQVQRIVQRAAQDAGLDVDVTPHWLRHGLASHALDKGAPLHLVQHTLGHANVATTSRYLHVRGDEGAGLLLDL